MNIFKIKELLPGYISNDESGRQLLEWYKFLSDITYNNRKLILLWENPTFNTISEFFRVNFDINVNDMINKINLDNQKKVMKGCLKFIYLSLGGETSPVCDKESLSKLLFYDYNFLVRISQIHGVMICELLYMIIKDDTFIKIIPNLDCIPVYNLIIDDIDEIYTVSKLITNEINDKISSLKLSVYDKDIFSYDNIKQLDIYRFAYYDTPIIVLPKYLTHLTIKEYYHVANVVYPKTLIYMKIKRLRSDIEFPDSIQELTIDSVSANLRIKLSKELKSLTYHGYYDITSGSKLPTSLIMLVMTQLDIPIDYLRNLKVLEMTRLSKKLPYNVKYIKTAILGVDLSYLDKLKYLICDSIDNRVKIPETVVYLNVNYYRGYVPDSVKYLLNDMINKPKHVKFIRNINNYLEGYYPDKEPEDLKECLRVNGFNEVEVLIYRNGIKDLITIL